MNDEITVPSSSLPPEESEPSFDIRITNGAAKMLQKIMEELNENSAKDVVKLGLQIINFALSEDADLIAKKKNGDDVRIVLPKKPSNG